MLAVAAFCVLALAGLPIITRYVLLAATLLAIFAGAGAFGWLRPAAAARSARGGRASARSRSSCWRSSSPSQAERIDRLGDALSRQEAIQGDLGRAS